MKVLILSTWFPYPLNQGSTIRAYHLIQAVARQHETALLSFEDIPVQPDWLGHMRAVCGQVEVVPRRPFARSPMKRALGLLSPRPSAVVAGYAPEMSARVRALAARWAPDAVFALTFVTAPYALEVHGVKRIADVDNLTAPMLLEAFRAAGTPLERLRRFAAYRKFQSYERELFSQFDLCLVVSERDRRALAEYVPLRPSQIGLVPNGVDLEHHRPGLFERRPASLVYNGALTYAANYDAVRYFLERIFPQVKQAVSQATLTVTGATQGVALSELPGAESVEFTGYLDDIRAVVGRSAVCVVPLRQGAGTRLKILEAMALGTPVVSTSKGAEGLDVVDGQHLLVADTPGDFAAQTIRLLQDAPLRRTLAQQALQRVRRCYGWHDIQRNLGQLVQKLWTPVDGR
ncbi:MAG: glycosyltransferase [Anaerolineales bacterium]|nr:glycosyltransferase [Anaerolineales bacterium]